MPSQQHQNCQCGVVLHYTLMTLALLLALAGSLVAMGVIVRRLDQA